MIKNILTIAYRNFLKYKVLFSVTIIGFAIGIACSLLIFIYLYSEYSYESMHKNRDRIYRLALTSQMENKSTEFATTVPALGPALQRTIPEIERTVRIVNEFSKAFIKVPDGQNIKGNNLLVVEPTFFDFFSFEFLDGNALGLQKPNEIVLSELLAQRLFGTTQVVGKTVILNNNSTLRVTAVIKGPPANTHMKFEALISWSTFLKDETVWDDATAYTYMLVSKQADMKVVKQKIDKFVTENKELSEVAARLDTKVITDIQPLRSIHFDSHRHNELSESGNAGLLYIFLTIALFFLFCSGFNYVNVAIANSLTRVKEVGMRKVFGAFKRQIGLQFFVESLIVVLLSVILAIAITIFTLRPFSKLIDQNLDLSIMATPGFILLLLVLSVLITLIAGSYPSFYLSSFNPIKIFRKKSEHAGGGHLPIRKTLIVIQLIVSTSIMACTMIVVAQLKYVASADIGFDKHSILYFNVPVQNAVAYIQQELSKDREVVAVSASTYWPHAANNDEYEIEQKDSSTAVYNVQKMVFDYSFVDLLGMKIIKGRNFSREYGADRQNAFLVNESMVKFFGWKEPIGKKIKAANFNKSGVVVGVVNDASLFSLHNKNSPMLFSLSADPVYDGEALFVKYNTQNIQGLVAKIKGYFDKAMGGDLPFEYSFLDESYDRLYRSDERYRKVIIIGALIMIFVSSLGLFGLSSFIANKRRGEIGIRKVLGASLQEIASLHMKGFLKLALIGGLLALPLSYYASWKWLQTFTMRIDIKPWVFLLAIVVTVIIVILTTAFHARRLSRINPVDTIRE